MVGTNPMLRPRHRHCDNVRVKVSGCVTYFNAILQHFPDRFVSLRMPPAGRQLRKRLEDKRPFVKPRMRDRQSGQSQNLVSVKDVARFHAVAADRDRLPEVDEVNIDVRYQHRRGEVVELQAAV